MRLIRYIIWLIPALLILSSCEEKIDLVLPEGSEKLVVRAEVSTQADSSFVHLSKTIAFLSKENNPAVNDAAVIITNTETNISDTFFNTTNGIYKPKAGYTGKVNSNYKLEIKTADNKYYYSNSYLYPMFRIAGEDSIFQKFEPAIGFLAAGYTLSYWSIEERIQNVGTYFTWGFNDSLFAPIVVFNGKDSEKNKWVPFELPFTRYNLGDTAKMYFRSIDSDVEKYIVALSQLSSGAPGPFQSPPANLPTNIRNGAVGYFMAFDIVSRQKIIK